MKIQKPVSLMMHEYLSGGRVDGFVGFEGLDEATVVTVVVGATVLEAVSYTHLTLPTILRV